MEITLLELVSLAFVPFPLSSPSALYTLTKIWATQYKNAGSNWKRVNASYGINIGNPVLNSDDIWYPLNIWHYNESSTHKTLLACNISIA